MHDTWFGSAWACLRRSCISLNWTPKKLFVWFRLKQISLSNYTLIRKPCGLAKRFGLFGTGIRGHGPPIWSGTYWVGLHPKSIEIEPLTAVPKMSKDKSFKRSHEYGYHRLQTPKVFLDGRNNISKKVTHFQRKCSIKTVENSQDFIF